MVNVAIYVIHTDPMGKGFLIFTEHQAPDSETSATFAQVENLAAELKAALPAAYSDAQVHKVHQPLVLRMGEECRFVSREDEH